MKFNLNDYKGKYAMHCNTKEEAESFCRFLHQNGRKWCNGHSYLQFDNWDRFKIDTVYYFNLGTYSRVEYVNYIILEWSDFVEDSEIVSECTVTQHK